MAFIDRIDIADIIVVKNMDIYRLQKYRLLPITAIMIK